MSRSASKFNRELLYPIPDVNIFLFFFEISHATLRNLRRLRPIKGLGIYSQRKVNIKAVAIGTIYKNIGVVAWCQHPLVMQRSL